MNSAIRLDYFKDIQLFLSSPVSLYKLNMYNIFAFPSLGSEIQVSRDRLLTFQETCYRLVNTKIKLLWYTTQYRLRSFQSQHVSASKKGERNYCRKVGNNSRYSLMSEDRSLLHH